MLFYYFASKDAVYRAVLERVVGGMVGIHEQFRSDPGPIGLAEAMEGITHFAAANLSAVRVLTREMMYGGRNVAELSQKDLVPLFAAGAARVKRIKEAGVFRPGARRHFVTKLRVVQHR